MAKKVVKYKRPIQINIGLIIYTVIFLYLVISVISFLTKKKISVHEVELGTIIDSSVYEGIAIRDELVVSSPTNGYINYYLRDGERTAKNNIICTIDETGKVADLIVNSSNSDTLLTKENYTQVKNQITSFHDFFSTSKFSDVYDFKYGLENKILELTNLTLVENLDTLLTQMANKDSFKIVAAGYSGIISYAIDGLEDININNITNEVFNTNNTKTQLMANKIIEANMPIYKIIKDENWSLVIPITEEEKIKFEEKKNIKVKFLKDDNTAIARISIFNQNGTNYAKLDFNSLLIRYMNDRFLNIEIVHNSAEGLKIPKSAMTTKNFYKVPINYLTNSGSSKGFTRETYLENGQLSVEFVQAELYYADDEYYYVDTKDFNVGDIIIKPEVSDRYRIGEMAQLEGTYSLNKGYAMFKLVEKLYENKEYCIIKTNTSYGLALYDHIATDASRVVESEIIY